MISNISFFSDDEIEKTFVEDVSSRVERWRKIREDNEMYNDVELSNEISGVLSEQAESARSERWKKIQELLMNIENEDNENLQKDKAKIVRFNDNMNQHYNKNY